MRFILLLLLVLLAATVTACKDPADEGSPRGNNIAEGSEACDGSDLNDHTCTSVDEAFSGGTLACSSDCTSFITTGCTSQAAGKQSIALDRIPQNVAVTTGTSQQVNTNPLTPIARYDVVPHQRFSRGEIFYFGVVAFSKEGINRVEFTVGGQGYSGLNPKVSTGMSYNPRTEVWEYWVPISASDFSGNGVFHVTAVVYGNDGGMRDLGELPLVINATGALARPEAWVDGTSGSNASGEVGNKDMPFATVGAAVDAIQNINGGCADGSVIYLSEGSYDLDGGNASTVNEWLTVTRAAGAMKENTIIVDGGAVQATQLLKISGLTLESTEGYNVIFSGKSNPDTLWIHNCRLIGAGQWIAGSNPVYRSGFTDYWTDSYITNTDFGVHNGLLARGMTIENIGNDAFQNTYFVVNSRVNGIDPGDTYWHADAYQTHTAGVAPPENRIVYNLFCTDLHYRGLFQRATSGQGTNNAFVNIFMEMRLPGRRGSENGNIILSSGALYGHWNHLLVWHCSFPTSRFSVAEDASGHGFTNSSFIGNIFWEFRDYETAVGSEPAYAIPENRGNNAFLYNHFMNAYGTTSSCTDGSGSPECPDWNATIADSAVDDSFTTGVDVVGLNDPDAGTFGYPAEGAAIIDRLPFVKVPVDINNYLRDTMPDIGAFEK